MGVRVLIMLYTLLSLIALIAAQTAAPAQAPAPPMSPSAFTTTYKIGASDVLSIKVFNEDALTNKYVVDTDGSITFPLLSLIHI